MSYYARENVLHLDGSRIFQTAEDRDHETEIALALGGRWNCEFRRFGALAAIDWYALRHERIVGIAELKSRSHAADHFETVFLNVRKWLSLHLAALGLGVPGLFVVRFTDGIRWIPVAAIDARQMRLGGCSKIVKAESDIEPVIEVAISEMSEVKEKAPAVVSGALT